MLKSVFNKIKQHYIIAATSFIVITAIVVSLLVIIPFPLNYGISEIVPLESDVIYVNNGTETPYLYKKTTEGGYSDEAFKIISFTDTHIMSMLVNVPKNSITIDMMKKNIEAEKPDLIIFTGDIITSSFTKVRAIGLAQMMEAYKVYWAPVFGNHDSEAPSAIKREELADLWSAYDYCLLEKGNVDGYCNYIVNIKTSETTVSQSLVFMDSGDYISEENAAAAGVDGGYDYIKPSQIQWYRDSVTAIQNQYGENTKSMVFFHIPLPEFIDAAAEGELLSGGKRENPCPSQYNSGMFTAIKELSSTQAIIVGHDHINDFDILYHGVHFIYNQPSGYKAYDVVSKLDYPENERIQGCGVITISSDGSFTYERRLNTRFEE